MSKIAAVLTSLVALAVPATWPLAAQAQTPTMALAGAPETTPPMSRDRPADGPADPGRADETGHAKECYAKVKFGAQYGVAPPSGPHFSWRQEPGPPGAPGPIWCLVSEPTAPRQILISPERYGWIRVLCDTEVTPERIIGVQRQLSAAGVYQGPIDGRYDVNTTAAVQRFQAERHIEDRGYLSYTTLTALNAYAQTGAVQRGCVEQRCVQTGYERRGYYQAPYPYSYGYSYPPAYGYAYRPTYGYAYWPLTTFDTGVLTWPGKR